MAPVLGFIVVAALGIGVAGWLHGRKREQPQAAPPAGGTPAIVDPFSDIPAEKPPDGHGATRMRLTSKAPEGLENTQVWVDARQLAERAYALAAEADAAKAVRDDATYRAKAKAAHAAFDQALESTVLWEQEIDELYGENDRQVRRIHRERSRWFDKMARYRRAGMGAVGDGD